jgi:hypothetical protein
MEFTKQQLEESRDHWSNLAKMEDDMADSLDLRGKPYGSTDTYRVRASIYRKTAQSIQIEIDTGVAVCSCCHKPYGTNQCVSSTGRRDTQTGRRF